MSFPTSPDTLEHSESGDGKRTSRSRAKRPASQISTGGREAAVPVLDIHPTIDRLPSSHPSLRQLVPVDNLTAGGLPSIRPAPQSQGLPDHLIDHEKGFPHATAWSHNNPSTADENIRKRQKRLEQNRAAAAASRMRKKSYVETLEGENARLTAEITSLKSRLGIFSDPNDIANQMMALRSEVLLLKSRLGIPVDPPAPTDE